MSSDPDVVADASPTRPLEERKPDHLSEAVLATLGGRTPEEVEAPTLAIFRHRAENVHAGFEIERTRLTFRIKSIDDEIARLREVANTIPTDRELKSEHERAMHAATGQIRSVEGEIRTKRYELERQRLRAELDRLAQEEAFAKDLLSAERKALYEQELRFWQETEIERARRIEYLEHEKQKLERELEVAEQKLERVRGQHVTRTLSGFLLWVGYGAAAATGTVTAVLLDERNNPSAPLSDALAGLRAFVLSITPAPSGPMAVLLVGALLAAGLVALGLVIFGTDFVISRFDRRWRGGSGRERGTRIALSAPDITRSSYVQLLAAFPFVFAVGMVASIFASGQTKDPNDLFERLFPSLVNTFIGTIIALVATAVFVMYVVKVVEVRDQSNRTWRASWELFVLPILLLCALLTSVISTTPSRPVWGTWSAFMLFSALTLAYGIVYHGLFKDVDKLRWTARRFEEEIRGLAAPPVPAAPTRQEVSQAKAIARGFARERERLRLLDQQFSLKRILTADDSDDFVLLDAWLRAYGKIKRGDAATPLRTYDAYRVLDVHAAPDEVARREGLRAEEAHHRTMVHELQNEIDDKRNRTSPARLDQLVRERFDCQAALDALLFEERRSLARLDEEREVEIQRIRGAIAVGIANKGAFDSVRNAEVPAPPPPPTPFPVRNEVQP